jgi:predicted metalloprotease with PDZ domain
VTPRGKQVNARLYFDSGAGISLILNTPFVQQHALDKELDKLISYKIQGMGEASSSVLATFPSLQIGKFAFTGVPVSLSRAKKGVSAAADIDGILGNDVIKHFNVLLNYQTKKMALVLNKQHRSGYKKHYSGGRYKIRNGKIFIDAILSNSPAEHAGLLPQDIILSVNGKIYNDIELFRKKVDRPGEKLYYTIERNGQVLNKQLIATSFY